MFNISQQFGIDWQKCLFQLLILIPVIWLPIRATIGAARAYTGVELPLWILISWLFPVVGPVVTLLVIRNRRTHSLP